MSDLADYVVMHTVRGECQCGLCIDRGDKPEPTGHTVDMIFFKVASAGESTSREFKRLTALHRGEFNDVDPFDRNTHSYIELGGWIGDQGLAMQYMALGVLLGVFELHTPDTLLHCKISDDTVRTQMAAYGALGVTAVQEPPSEETSKTEPAQAVAASS